MSSQFIMDDFAQTREADVLFESEVSAPGTPPPSAPTEPRAFATRGRSGGGGGNGGGGAGGGGGGGSSGGGGGHGRGGSGRGGLVCCEIPSSHVITLTLGAATSKRWEYPEGYTPCC